VQKAIDPTISTWPQEDPQLIGSGCGACGAKFIPFATDTDGNDVVTFAFQPV
jgi:hypothetical protein